MTTTTNTDLLQKFANLTPEQRAQIMAKLKAQGVVPAVDGQHASANKLTDGAWTAKTTSAAAIPAIDRTKPIPLSFPQEQLWFLHQLEPENPAYNERVAMRLEGALDVNHLAQALQLVVQRHESLRTTFGRVAMHGVSSTNGNDADQAVQIIQPFLAGAYPLQRQTIARLYEGDQQLTPEASDAINAITLQPFDLEVGPLWRLGLFSEPGTGRRDVAPEQGQHLLLLVIHHIIADAWSISIFLQELAACYTALDQGQSAPLPELSATYADFAGWQRRTLQGDTLSRQLHFWQQSLADAPPFLPLPTDFPRPSVPSGRGGVRRVQFGRDLTQQLKSLGRKMGATLYMTLLSAFAVLLARYSNQDDLVIGSVQANRADPQLEVLIGHFVNTLAIRTHLPGSITFRQLLQQMREQLYASYDHQTLPFQLLVQALQPERTLGSHPLYQVTFNLQNQPGFATAHFAQAFAGLKATPLPLQNQTSKVDLYLLMFEVQGMLVGEFEYNTDLFDPVTIARMASHFTMLLESIVAQPDQPVLHLPLLTPSEYRQIVHEWNDTAVDFGSPQTIHALFEQQVARTPDAIAVVLAGDQGRETGDWRVAHAQSLTYAELNARANQLTHHLVELNVQPDTLVAVAMERSIEMLVALLAVLKAGCAYVPIDPTYPVERMKTILADAPARILVTRTQYAHTIQTVADMVDAAIDIDLGKAGIARQTNSNPQPKAQAHNLAYVLYTSGSTGAPKGVMVEHRNLFNYIQGIIKRVSIKPCATFALAQSLQFDLGLTTLYPALVTGGTLHILNGDVARDSAEFVRYLKQNRIDYLKITPSHLVALLDTQEDSLDIQGALILGGEAADPQWLARLQSANPHLPIFNHFGPTETTIGVLVYPVQSAVQQRRIPIGRPLPNNSAFIFNTQQQLVPIGVPGELYIAGKQLARGYLNRPDLTAERFINHPEFGRLYKTGDRCRWLPDGNIEFLGRTDFQVKIRGFRIELSEIENTLLAQEGVREAVVLAREDTPGDKRLVAYVVGETEQEILRQALVQRLPDYMIPAAFVPLDAMPLTSNGKLDRRALPAPDYAVAQNAFVAPRTALEAQVAAIWQEVLGIAQVGVYDNFFTLGGHSLLATQVVSQLRRKLMVELPLKSFFEAKTLGDLSVLVKARQSRSVDEEQRMYEELI